MTSHPEDRTDERADQAITATSLDTEGRPVPRSEPLDEYGQPIFPPEPAGRVGSTRLLPDSASSPPPVDDQYAAAPPVDDRYAAPGPERDTGAPEESYTAVPIPGNTDEATYAAPAGDLPPVSEPVPGPEPALRADSDDETWLALQGAFVDDPAQAVRDAGNRIEQQLATFRSALDDSDTEALRKAFKAFRDLSTILR